MNSKASFRCKRYLHVKGQLHDFSIPKIMGILNITPDSFFAESRQDSMKTVELKIQEMMDAGVDIIDIGASSTRPDAIPISAEEEINRLKLIIPGLKELFPSLLFSIDTYQSEVASFAIEHGFDLINDVSGGQFDPRIWEIASQNLVPYVLTYNRGTSKNNKKSQVNGELIKDALRFFSENILELEKRGVHDIILDLGFGFAKTIDENYELMRHFELFHIFEKPILVGISRKSMIREKIHVSIDKSLNGSSILHTLCYLKNAKVFRVHDVKEMKEVCQLMESSL